MNLKERANILERVDQELVLELQEETSYWKNVPRRVVTAFKKLASHDFFPLRGDNEEFSSVHNGNFLILLEYLSEFYQFLEKHFCKY